MAFDIPTLYLDKSNQVIQSDGGGGDSLQRAGFIMIGEYFLLKHKVITQDDFNTRKEVYLKRLDLLQDSLDQGKFARNSTNPSDWTAQFNRMSRDQVTSNIIALGLINEQTRLSKIVWSNAKRAMLFTTNTRGNTTDAPLQLPDLTLFGVWAMYIRAKQVKWLKPLLYLFDLSLLANAEIKTRIYAKDAENADDLGFIEAILQAKEQYPTFISNWAIKIYNQRGLANKTLENGYMSSYGPQTALDYYFDPAFGGCPVIADIYRQFLQKELNP